MPSSPWSAAVAEMALGASADAPGDPPTAGGARGVPNLAPLALSASPPHPATPPASNESATIVLSDKTETGDDEQIRMVWRRYTEPCSQASEPLLKHRERLRFGLTRRRMSRCGALRL